MNRLYRIYTEDKNRSGVMELVTENFKGFTVIPCYGYWKGIPENSIIIEIVTDGTDFARTLVNMLAEQIKFYNKQETVIVTDQGIQTQFI